MENADARTAVTALRKAARNQVLFDVITQQDLAIVEEAGILSMSNKSGQPPIVETWLEIALYIYI